MSYAPAADPLALAGERDAGRISVYAQGADYHDVIKKALKHLARWLVEEAGCELKVFVDTAPVMEKPLPRRLGSAGKASTPTSSAARRGAGCFSARSIRRSIWIWSLRRRRTGPLRVVQRLPGRLPYQRLPDPVPARCPALHLLSHDRA
jgi:hypothetical protein